MSDAKQEARRDAYFAVWLRRRRPETYKRLMKEFRGSKEPTPPRTAVMARDEAWKWHLKAMHSLRHLYLLQKQLTPREHHLNQAILARMSVHLTVMRAMRLKLKG